MLQENDLIEPRVAGCMAPDAGPANLLVLSKPSLTELTSRPDPFWLGARPLEPGRVAVLVRTAEMSVHVIELDPADGTVKASKVLFATAAPGR